MDCFPSLQLSIILDQLLQILKVTCNPWNQNNRAIELGILEVRQGNAVILSQSRNSILESSQHDGLSNVSVTYTIRQGIHQILNLLTVSDRYKRVWTNIKAQLFQHWVNAFLNLVHQTLNWIRSEERRVGKECRYRWW